MMIFVMLNDSESRCEGQNKGRSATSSYEVTQGERVEMNSFLRRLNAFIICTPYIYSRASDSVVDSHYPRINVA